MPRVQFNQYCESEYCLLLYVHIPSSQHKYRTPRRRHISPSSIHHHSVPGHETDISRLGCAVTVRNYIGSMYEHRYELTWVRIWPLYSREGTLPVRVRPCSFRASLCLGHDSSHGYRCSLTLIPASLRNRLPFDG